MQISKQDKPIFIEFLKELLNEANPKPKDDVINRQVESIEDAVQRFNGGKLLRRYKEKYRKIAKPFYYGMHELLTIDKQLQNISSLTISLKDEGGKEKKVVLPLSVNSGDIKEGLFNYMCQYYENNPVERYIKGLSPKINEEYILNGYKQIRKRFNILDDKILKHAPIIEFPFFILSHIKKFEQFNKPQRDNSILTNSQGRFIIKLMILIGLSPILPQNIKASNQSAIEFPNIIKLNLATLRDDQVNGNVKKLRNSLAAYLKAISNLDDYLVTG